MIQSKYGRDIPQNGQLYRVNEFNVQGLNPQKVNLGPIIGKTTDSTTRILIEFALDGYETLILTAPDGLTYDCQKRVIANRPTVFEFRNLKPRTLYKVSSNYDFQCSSAFRTLSTGSAPINFAFVSCNSRRSYNQYNESNNLWSDIATRAVSGELDYIIHFGDQIYADFYNDVYDKCIDVLKKSPREDWPLVAETVRDMLREEYRLTFTAKLEATALANCPSLMQYDDHEIRDDLGFRPEDTDVNTPDGFYIQQARYVYYEYQRQLREDIDFNDLDKIKYEFHMHIINNVAIYIFDYRGKKLLAESA